jgi:mannose-6-phosphate isomerase-like protein (cupin superfamily)
MGYSLTGLSVADTSAPIETHAQQGGTGVVYNKALLIPGHLGGPWRSLEYVLIPKATAGIVSSVGMHTQASDELYSICQGSGMLTTGGHAHAVASGCLAIAPRGTEHSICNESSHSPLGLLVLELAAREEVPPLPAVEFACVPALLKETTTGFHPAKSGGHRLALRAAAIDLSRYFSAPAARLTLIELPAGGHIEPYSEEEQDEVLFVLKGQADIDVAAHRFQTREDGLSVVVPCGVPRRITNRSSISAPLFLSVLVDREGDAQ